MLRPARMTSSTNSNWDAITGLQTGVQIKAASTVKMKEYTYGEWIMKVTTKHI